MSSILDKIEEWFVNRNLKRRRIKPTGKHSQRQFQRVLNTLRENKVMVSTEKDGIYIRLAGSNKDEINSTDWVKVVDFRDDKLNKMGL